MHASGAAGDLWMSLVKVAVAGLGAIVVEATGAVTLGMVALVTG